MIDVNKLKKDNPRKRFVELSGLPADDSAYIGIANVDDFVDLSCAIGYYEGTSPKDDYIECAVWSTFDLPELRDNLDTDDIGYADVNKIIDDLKKKTHTDKAFRDSIFQAGDDDRALYMYSLDDAGKMMFSEQLHRNPTPIIESVKESVEALLSRKA